MDALLPAFLAALLAEIGDKTMILAALLGARYKAPGAVLAGIFVAALGNSLIAAIGGSLVADLMSFRAATLMLALALGFAGVGAFLPQKPPRITPYARIGAFGTAAIGFFALELGDKTQFLTFAIAARTDSIGLVGAGATAGILAASTVAVLGGHALLERLPVRLVRAGVGGLFVLLAAICAIFALRLA